jgi:hypothetical protein
MVQNHYLTKKYIELHRKIKSYYCSCNQDKNFTRDTDSTTIGIELCKIPQISEHCRLFLRLFSVIE